MRIRNLTPFSTKHIMDESGLKDVVIHHDSIVDGYHVRLNDAYGAVPALYLLIKDLQQLLKHLEENG